MTFAVPNSAGLSGDLGWNEGDEGSPGIFSTLLLVLTTGAVWGSIWLVRGLQPLSVLVSRAARRSENE